MLNKRRKDNVCGLAFGIETLISPHFQSINLPMKTKPKKAGSANLEKNRILFFETGIVIALSISLIAFEWATPEKKTG